MKSSRRRVRWPFAFLLVVPVAGCGQPSDPAQPVSDLASSEPSVACAASADWVTNPNPPAEIPGGGANLCEFYQFSWEWFLYLMTPSSDDPAQRNFQVAAEYPVLQIDGDSCSGAAAEPVFFVRTIKSPEDTAEFVLPERIGQAGGGDAIYDQSGNVVFYSIRFGRGLCTAPDSGDLPADTTEIKIAWKIIDDADKGNYVWIDADIVGNDDVKETLGLIGYHLVRGTALHPEFVWASWEHKDNSPDCVDPDAARSNGWAFLSGDCAACAGNATAECFAACGYNAAKPLATLTGPPTEICRVFPEGTASGDYEGPQNVADVTSLNQQLVGDNGILTSLPESDPMAVLANYFNIGALWLSDPADSAATSNQRGSLQLANAVMETTFQGSLSVEGSSLQPSTTGGLNCFVCHAYTPGQTATTGLSHIFDDIVKQRAAGGGDR